MNEFVIIGTVIVGLVGFGAGLYGLERARRKRALYLWAAANDYKLIAFHQPLLTEQTPFPFTVSKAQQIFHVSVLQNDGQKRSGWLLLEGARFGQASKHAQVKWDA